jgi:hypothetical protein
MKIDNSINSNLLIKTPPKKDKNSYRNDDITSPFELNENKMINSSLAHIFLKPLTLSVDVDYNTKTLSNNNIYNDYNDNIMKTIKQIHQIIGEENQMSYNLHYTHYLVLNAISDSNLYPEIKMCIIITSLFTIFDDSSINIDDFINNLQENHRDLIKEMYYLINNENNTVSYWKLIPRYIAVLGKINQTGIMKFVKSVNHEKLYSEMTQFVKIVNSYRFNFNNNYINIVFTNCVKMISNINIDININIDNIKDSIF